MHAPPAAPSGFPVRASQKPSLPVWSPAASELPSGLIAMALIHAVILMTGPIGSRVAPFQSRIVPSCARGDEHRSGRVEHELETRAAPSWPCACAIERVVEASHSQTAPSRGHRGDGLAVGPRRNAPHGFAMLHGLADPAVASQLPYAGDAVFTPGDEHAAVRAESHGADWLLMGQRSHRHARTSARSTTAPCCRRQPRPAASRRG